MTSSGAVSGRWQAGELSTRFALVSMLLALGSALLLWPGFVTSDGVSQLQQARSGYYNDWHPPFVAWLWGYIDRIVPGTKGMLVLQLLGFWCAVYLVLSALVSCRAAWLRVTSSMALFVFPPVLGWAGVIGKDMLMLVAALLATGFILRLSRPMSAGNRFAIIVMAIVLLVVAIASRHNGMFLVVGLSLLVVLLQLGLVKLPYALLAGAAVLFVPPLGATVVNGLLTDERSWPAASLLVHDISGVASRELNNPAFLDAYADEVNEYALKPGHTLDELPAWHDPRDWLYASSGLGRKDDSSAPPVSRKFDGEQYAALKRLWVRIIVDHPMSYLVHRWDVFKHLLAIGPAKVVDPICLSNRSEMTAEKLGLQKNEDRSKIQRIIGWRIEWLVHATPLFEPWPYYIAAWLLLFSVLLARSPMTPVLTGLLVSGLAHESALFVIAPAAEYRYSAWLMVIVAIALIALLAQKGRKTQGVDR